MFMKYILLFLCFTESLLISAQDDPSNENLISLDTMLIKVVYNVDWHYNLEKPEKVKHDKMFTEIGRAVCHSYIEREWNNEVDFNKHYENDGNRDTKAFNALYSNIGEIFINYPKGKTTNIYSMDILGTYKFEEATPKMRWHITNDKLDTLSYHCTLAKCSYAGREYRAWFTEDIPVSYGPWKLGGLPGLIIKAETMDGDYKFTLAGVEIAKDAEFISLWKRDFVKSTKKKTRNQEKMLLARPDAIMDQMGIEYGVVTFDGSPAKWKFFTFDNPLEKE